MRTDLNGFRSSTAIQNGNQCSRRYSTACIICSIKLFEDVRRDVDLRSFCQIDQLKGFSFRLIADRKNSLTSGDSCLYFYATKYLVQT